MMIEWSDKQGNRDRQAWMLLITPDGKVVPFAGGSIPGVVAVVGYDCCKAGKWSHTTYRLTLAPGVRPVRGRDGWETGRFVEGLAASPDRLGSGPVDRWIDLANALGVGLEEAKRFLHEWRPKAAEALDRVEENIQAVDIEAPQDGASILRVTFGSPSRREVDNGFWERPVVILNGNGEIGRVSPSPIIEGGWGKPVTSGTVKVLSVAHSSGHKGGTYTLTLAVPDGATWRHGAA